MLSLLLLFDIVVFANGNSVEGKVTKVTDEVIVVQVKGGELVIPRERVKKIVEKPYKIEEEPPSKEEPQKQQEPSPPLEKKEPEEGKKKEKPEDGENGKEQKEKPLTQEELHYLRRLVDLIGNRRVALRRRARLALSQFGPRATPVLINALSDGNFWRRMNAASLLGEFGRPEAAKPLLPLLADPVLAVRVAAHSALTRITKTYVTYNPNHPTQSAISLWHKAVQNFLNALKEKKEHKKPSSKSEPKKQSQQKPPWERRPPQTTQEEKQQRERKPPEGLKPGGRILP